MKCIVKGCTNYTHEGRFVGDLCAPCHTMLVTGKDGPSNAWFVKAIEGAKKAVLKDIIITSKENGEVVAVTLTDEDHKIYKVLWEKK